MSFSLRSLAGKMVSEPSIGNLIGGSGIFDILEFTAPIISNGGFQWEQN